MMREPSVRTSRLAIAGALAAILIVGGGGFFLGRETAPTPPAPPPVIVTAPASSPAPAAPEELGRADLVRLAEQAADAFASGKAAPKSVADAADQRFALLLPFGCAGPSDAGSDLPATWRFDQADKTLRISFGPTIWRGTDWGLSDQAGVDAAEGFWINRPWSSSGTCPPRSDQAAVRGTDPVTLPGQSLAIAQIFRDDADRDGRRDGRPFEIVKRVEAETFDASQGFRLRVTGRIERIAGGAPVRCIQPGGIEQRPICLIGTRIDAVRMENPRTGEVLATWSIGRSRQ